MRRKIKMKLELTTCRFPLFCVSLLCMIQWEEASSFINFTPRTRALASCSLLHAKPPPTSQFDLESIEAFEESLFSSKDENTEEEYEPLIEMDSLETFIIPTELKNSRIDAALATLLNMSRSAAGNLVTQKQVFMQQDNGEFTPVTQKSLKMEEGAALKVLLEEAPPLEIKEQNIPLDILYEDEYMIVLNKAAGMVVHPSVGNWDGTLVNALAYYLKHSSPYQNEEFISVTNPADPLLEQEHNSFYRPGIVHRLDKGTTGVIVVAKTKEVLGKLSEAFASRDVKKSYLAIAVGNPGERVVIDKPIGRHPVHRQKMRVVPDPSKMSSQRVGGRRGRNVPLPPTTGGMGRNARSFVDTIAFDGKLSFVQVRIVTGRTHQIRVHLQDRHTPIYGDDIYGLPDWNKKLQKQHGITRPLLHAHRLEIDHPISGEKMVFVAPLPEDMSCIALKIWPQGMDERPQFFSHVS